MRHRKSNKKFNRDFDHRRALFRNLTLAFFEHGHITTTVAKAKAVRPRIEKLITLAKEDTLAHRRLAARWITNKVILRKLFKEIAPNYLDRNGGYTRIIRLYRRPGDAAEMARLELVEPASSKESKPEKT